MENYTNIIVSGNPTDGYQHWGPFEDGETAAEWAEKKFDGDWWLTTLDEPTP